MNIVADQDTKQGRYANLGLISHRREEFIFDFLLYPPVDEPGAEAILVSRVIVSPAHFKRLYSAMQEQIQKYESNYGTIMQPVRLEEE